ncbi:spore coat protein GerQ [Pontibacillus yanchengensis]|uniref:Spore coat protein n=1 Tax=Pontibacillus yanchengensis Y32 TaxID=1385514 RepID=A0A0A2TEB0_9BACI|nr:spore coat protein GerQ [Pontibacillus yanchengensis]KGP74192.1 spore coat protein [Pontibacillus yanchengensis Y32]
MTPTHQGGSYGQGNNPYSYGQYRQQGQGGQPMMYPYQSQMATQQQMPQQMQQPKPQQQGQFQVPPFPQTQSPGYTNFPGMLPEEESYIENILRLNKGKQATVYMTFENNENWNAKVFKGIIEAAGRDHIILSDPETGIRYLLLMVYLDYITFPEEINYAYPYGGNTGSSQR